MKRQCDYCGKVYEAKTSRSRFCRPACRVHFSIAKNSPLYKELLSNQQPQVKRVIEDDCCEELAAHEQNMAALRETLISRYPGLLDDLSEFFG